MEKIDDQHYTISLPHLTRTRLTCELEDYVELEGSYLVTIPTKCILRTAEFTIINNYGEVKGQPFKIMMIPDIKAPTIETPQVQLNTINLESLHSIHDKILLQKPLTTDHISSEILYHTTGPFYGILIIVLVILTIFIIRCYRTNKPKENHEAEATNETIYAEPGKAKTHPVPATFSLNVLK